MKLGIDFYLEEDVTKIAPSLLGKDLMVRNNSHVTGGRIVEVEAYSGSVDRASHAFQNKITARTQVMFRRGGVAYVYLCYGIHHLFNIVTNKKGFADAILVRAVEPLYSNIDYSNRQNNPNDIFPSTSGPGKLTKVLGINMNHNGMDLLGDEIWIEDNENNIVSDQIVSTKRVGVDYAGKDADLPWRYYIEGNKWISKK